MCFCYYFSFASNTNSIVLCLRVRYSLFMLHVVDGDAIAATVTICYCIGTFSILCHFEQILVVCTNGIHAYSMYVEKFRYIFNH